jgi:hypothetical protein
LPLKNVGNLISRAATWGCEVWFALACAGIREVVFAVQAVWFFAFSLASALCLRASSVAPVRGGTYFSLPPQRKVGKRKRLTPPVLVFA